MNKLEIQNVTFGYKRNHNVLNNLSLTLEDGIHVFLGVNGSGKTTLFKLITGILPLKKGRIMLNGKSGDLRNMIAYVPQTFNVYPNMKVYDFLSFIYSIRKAYCKKSVKETIDEVSEMADISEFLDKKMKELSEGMRRRVGIAQALIGDAALIVADEPTAGLDPEQRYNFNNILSEIGRSRILFISTHIIEDIEKFYDSVCVLSKGAVTFKGTFGEFAGSLDDKLYKCCIEKRNTLEKSAKVVSEARVENGYEVCYVPGDKGIIEGSVKVADEEISFSQIWTYYR